MGALSSLERRHSVASEVAECAESKLKAETEVGSLVVLSSWLERDVWVWEVTESHPRLLDHVLAIWNAFLKA